MQIITENNNLNVDILSIFTNELSKLKKDSGKDYDELVSEKIDVILD